MFRCGGGTVGCFVVGEWARVVIFLKRRGCRKGGARVESCKNEDEVLEFAGR